MSKQSEIMKLIAALGEYYDKALTPTQLAMYADDLKMLEPEQLGQAIVTYRNDPRNHFFPLPVKLKSMIGLALNPDDEAVQISGRILSAIASIGPYQSEKAREAIGDVGWQVVQAEGGWQMICEVQTDDIPIRKAQWRNLAKSFCERQMRSSVPQLPDPGGSSISLLGILKEMPKPKTGGEPS